MKQLLMILVAVLAGVAGLHYLFFQDLTITETLFCFLVIALPVYGAQYNASEYFHSLREA